MITPSRSIKMAGRSGESDTVGDYSTRVLATGATDRPMKVLVTGGAGFIGSHTVDLLLARGHSVRILDALLPPVHRDGQPPAYLPAEAEFIRSDVRERAAWEQALAGIQAVFHLAAYHEYLPDF